MALSQRFRNLSTYPLLLRVVDLSLAGAVMVLPLVMGGRHPWGYLLLVTLAISASVGWLLHLAKCKQVIWIRSPLRIVLAAAICLLFVQMIPLPSCIQNWLSPNIQNLLPLSNGEVVSNCLPRWSQLSFMPAATRQGLVALLAYILLFCTTVQRARELSDVERLLKCVGAAAITMATFGLLQYLLSNGCFFWFYEHPYRDTNDVVKGAFINRNHFAHFLALGIPPLIWWLLRQSSANREGSPNAKFRTRRQHSAFPLWLWLGFGIVWLAGLLSLSRGGIAAMLLAAIASAVLLKRVTQFNARLTWSMIGLGALVIVGLTIHGAQGVLNRLDEVTSGSMEKLDRSSGRRQIWLADWQAIKEFPIFGTGVGSHAAVYPIFFAKSSDELEYTHAESGYLQVALETGAVGLILTFSAIGVIGFWCWRAYRESESTRLVACVAATTASLIVSGLHSLVDFVWFIPGCMATTIILAACSYRLWLLSGAEARLAKYTSRFLIGQWRLATVSVCVLGIWMLVVSIGPSLAAPAWDRYLRLSVAVLKTDLRAADEAIKDNHPSSDVAAELSRRRDALQAMISELQSVVRYDSSHVLARVHLAAARLQWFELLQQDAPLPMPLSAVRDAALESHFKSRTELDAWLRRAVGPHYSQLEAARREIRQALALCPLYGEAYLYLSDLCFLEGAQQTTKSQFLAQALAVRPYDGEVHFEAGKECFLQNQTQAAVDHWRLAFHSGQEFKSRLIDLFTGNLAGQVPVSFFLENFQPDLEGLRQLRERYRQLPLADDRTALWRYSAEQLTCTAAQSQATVACALWLEAESLYRDLGDAANRLNCVQQALAVDGGNYSAHYAAVNCFYDQKDYSNAEQQAKWCLARAPNDANLKRVRDEVVKARVSAGDQHSVQVTRSAQPARPKSSNSRASVDASIER